MAIDPVRAKSIFLQASELADPAERAGFLDRECGDDADLRDRLEALLRANDAAPFPVDATGTFTPNAALTADHPGKDEHVGAVIAGKYTLVEPIGEGGMGSVWRAKQTEPVKRYVAVKLIKAGMDSKQVLARFEAERQALAMMDHPNIAKVLDGGLHENRPFFVMELVKGTPITEYCDHCKLNPQKRLELFVQVCHAIQHAHQKGIIHRDIKPSNVLIALYDDKPVVKVIDFGVAKATGAALTEHTIDTGFGGVVGTPQYMSPEQATFNNLDIDTRSDVYSLGVLLYELLAGSPPFSGPELKKKGLLEILRVVREEEPPRPSTKLSTADALPSLSANRGTEPKKLTGLLRNELDWIVMKALEKDRTRRYETANGFAADCLRYLSGEAVQAHPPSTAYRVKKFVKRHKGQVLAAGLVFVSLVAGVAGTTLGFVRADGQRQIAEANESRALAAANEERQAKLREAERADGETKAKQLAETKRQEAETQQQRAEAGEKLAGERLVQVRAEKQRADEEKQIAQAVNDFLQNKLLAQADTRVQAIQLLRDGGLATEAKYNPTIKELLDRAAKELAPDKIEANFPNQPLVQAQILRTVGDAYRGIGEAATGIPFLARSVDLFKAKLGNDHPETLTSISGLAWGYRAAGKFDLSLPLLEETLKLLRAKQGDDHPDTLFSMNNLALGYLAAGKFDLALPLLEKTFKLRMAKQGADHPDTLISMNNLALGYQDAGKFDLAMPLLEETLKLKKTKLGPDHPDTLNCMGNLATGYRAAGKHDLALPLYEETLKLMKAKLGADHPDTLSSVNNLALGYQAAGKLGQALPLLEETLKLTKAKQGADHPDTLTSMNNLASGFQAAGKLGLALPLFEETLKLRKTKLGPDHPDTLTCTGNLALGYQAAGKLDLALPLFEETLKLMKAKLGADHPDTLTSMNNLANAYHDAGRLDLALPLGEETLKLRKAKLGPNHPDTVMSMGNVAGGYWSLRRLDKSVPLFEELLPLQEKKLGRGHPDTQTTVANLGVNYKDVGRLKEALPHLEEAYRSSHKIPTLKWVGTQLLDAYAKAGQSAEASNLVAELLANAREQFPMQSSQLARQLAPIGRYLLESKTFADAEPLLRECLRIRQKQEPDDWRTFNTQSMLGEAMLGLKKYADAEPTLLMGYEGMKAREKSIPPQGEIFIPEAIDRLIELYTATNKPAEAAKWRAERAQYPPELAPFPRRSY